MNEDAPVAIPIDGVLDLHTFRPAEVKALVTDYLAACRERGILQVRLIHGKGTGALRETVHALLRRLPEVVSFQLADASGGGWGATVVHLREMPSPSPPTPDGENCSQTITDSHRHCHPATMSSVPRDQCGF